LFGFTANSRAATQGYDVFRRGERVRFYTTAGSVVDTTVAQLNFCMWLLRYKVLDWVCQNRDVVEKDMNKTLQQAREARLNGTRRRRSQLVRDVEPPVKVAKADRVLFFDAHTDDLNGV
tara:strand:+ start:2659 stop:3015 length:357 start_codon:yes stop_codon:yes gene_type:complete